MSGRNLDAEVIAAIKGGCSTLAEILQSLRVARSVQNERTVDRTLQRLRKDGVIRFERGSGGGWRLEVRPS